MDSPEHSREERQPDPATSDLRRNSEEIVARLANRGITVSPDERADRLVHLLEAVETFERAVQQSGGDLMVDEPVKGGAPIEPDDAAFVLPQQHDDESITDFIDRVRRAAAVAKAIRG